MNEFFHELGHMLWHSLSHAVIDTLKLVPFLFLTYLLMEFLEHKTGDATERRLRSAGKWGPLLGGTLGMLPQCGFSAAASGLYTGRIITTGTLIAVYLSTSDEMLPILISSGASVGQILKLLGSKVVIGVIAGFCVDGVSRLWRRNHPVREEAQFEDLCEREKCHCGDRFVLSALKHTVYITLFLLIFTFLMGFGVEIVGEDRISSLVLNRPVLGSVLAAVVGLIPNCASSVVLTSLFMEGVISAGAVMAGLLVNAGIGLAILFRNNRPLKDSFRVVLILVVISVLCGILIDLTPLKIFLSQ